MSTDYNLQFLRGKLNCISNAIMYNMSLNTAALPNGIVHFLDIDEQGRILFSMQPPAYERLAMETSMPVRLFFYQKGLDYYIEAQGTACIEREEVATGAGESRIYLSMTPAFFQFEEFSRQRWLAQLEKWYMTVSERVRMYYLKKIKHYGYQA